MRVKNILVFLLLLSSLLMAQESKAEWEPVFNEGSDKIYIDVAGIANFKGEDIYVWVLTEHTIPIVIESIKDDIYRTNTYYLFNTRLNKYSLLYIIYYDQNKNVLASFDYGRNTTVEEYQYNYPVWKDSIEDRILEKCIDVVNSKKK
jgi:hypothetical protein